MFHLRQHTILFLYRAKNVVVPSKALPSVNGRSRLLIDNAMKTDDGTYMCVAENPAGVKRALAAVRVKGELMLRSLQWI